MRMAIIVDSFEYKCWHEVGHATVCLNLGGDIDFIEFLADDPRGHARTRCTARPGTERNVACGGFAAEFYLLKNDYAEQGRDDKRDINCILFDNAGRDMEDFWGRKLGKDEAFTEAAARGFMNHAIGPDGRGGVLPIFEQHCSGMQELARELCASRRVEGRRVKELLRLGIPS